MLPLFFSSCVIGLVVRKLLYPFRGQSPRTKNLAHLISSHLTSPHHFSSFPILSSSLYKNGFIFINGFCSLSLPLLCWVFRWGAWDEGHKAPSSEHRSHEGVVKSSPVMVNRMGWDSQKQVKRGRGILVIVEEWDSEGFWRRRFGREHAHCVFWLG